MVEWWLTESHAVLVEESPSVFQLLTKSVHEEFDPTLKRIMPLNALICEEGQHKVFYGDDVDKLKAANVTRNLSLPHWVEYQISSLERKSTLQGLNRYFREARRHFPETVKLLLFKEPVGVFVICGHFHKHDLDGKHLGNVRIVYGFMLFSLGGVIE